MNADDLAAHVAARMGSTLSGLGAVRNGGNNAVLRVELAGLGPVCVKRYPPVEAGRTDRFRAEHDALTLIGGHPTHRDAVPGLLMADPDERWIATQWIEGCHVAVPTEADVDQLLAFIAALAGLAKDERAQAIGPASAATFSLGQVLDQLRQRRDLFAAQRALLAPEVVAFLEAELDPTIAGLVRAHGEPDEELPPARRCLSPSDFGFHNALRTGDGRLVFLDLEYFGWDDPVKMIVDLTYHPGHSLLPHQQRRIRATALDVFAGDPGFSARLERYEPLFRIIWCLIVLNPFLPAHWRKLVTAKGEEAAAEERGRRLGRARERLADLIG